MRLIDANEVIKVVDKHTRKECSEVVLDNDISYILEEVSTAYDVDKVVEQVKVEIESDKINYEFYVQKENKNMQSAYAGKITAFKNAINIIRAGGKEQGSDGNFISNTSDFIGNSDSNRN